MSARSSTVLVVEDEPSLAELFAEWLSAHHEVRVAHDGDEALDDLDASVDCVLLDRRMPGLSGAEVLEAIRERGVDCRVAMVTAVTPDYDVLEMGFDDYVVKPVSRSDLVSLVDELLSVGSYDDAIQRYFQLASKKAAIETSKSAEELAENEAYNDVLAELDRVGAEADESFEDVFELGNISDVI